MTQNHHAVEGREIVYRSDDDALCDNCAENSNTLQMDPSLLRPAVSAADIGPSGYTRVWFDEHIGDMIEAHGKARAPDRCSQWHHIVGVAGEVAVGAWQGVPMDRRILPDYEGDDGFDLLAPDRYRDRPLRIEVKATQDRWNPEQMVNSDKIDCADRFVLCATGAPREYVDIVGYTSRPLLKIIGKTYGRDGFLLTPEHLHPTGADYVSPDEVREVMYG